jgi:hypothetical protein
MKRPIKYQAGQILISEYDRTVYRATDIDPLLDQLELFREELKLEKVIPIRSQRCVAYYCPKGNKKLSYKVEFKGKHLRWLDNREDVEYLLKLIDGKL